MKGSLKFSLHMVEWRILKQSDGQILFRKNSNAYSCKKNSCYNSLFNLIAHFVKESLILAQWNGSSLFLKEIEKLSLKLKKDHSKL